MVTNIIIPPEQLFYQRVDEERDKLYEQIKKIIPSSSYPEYKEEHEELVLKFYNEVVRHHKAIPLITSVMELIESNIFTVTADLYAKFVREIYIVQIVDDMVQCTSDEEDFIDYPEDYTVESAYRFIESNGLDSAAAEDEEMIVDETAQDYIDSVSVHTVVEILRKHGCAINFPPHFFGNPYIESECYYRGQLAIELNSAQSVLFPELGVWQEDLLKSEDYAKQHLLG